MHKALPLSLLLFGSLCCVNLYAADAAPAGGEREGAGWSKECQRVKNLQLPKEDIPSKALLDSMAGCNAEKLYYHAKSKTGATKADWDKARACALAINDSDVLMMLYANGYGAKLNPDLAIKYACDVDDHLFNPKDVIEGITQRRNGPGSAKGAFDLCDYAYASVALNYCSGLMRDREDIEFSIKYSEIEHRLTPEQKMLFGRLREAVENFSNGRENDVSAGSKGGSLALTFELSAGVMEKDQFLRDVEQCEKGQLPSYTPEQLVQFDKSLNDLYRTIMHLGPDDLVISDVRAYVASIRKTERAWLKYRDAWVAFGTLRYPQVPSHAWKAWLTERRVKTLEAMSHGEDPAVTGAP